MACIAAMQSEASRPSDALWQAQQQLLELRAQWGIGAQDAPRSAGSPAVPERPDWARLNAQKLLRERRALDGICVPVAGAGRGDHDADDGDGRGRLLRLSSATDDRGNHGGAPTAPPTFVAQPTLLLAILKQNREAPARIYFLLRHIDRAGRGWLYVDDIRERLTRKAAPLKVCGWRRLRQLLHEGEGLFWRRDGQGRLWLRGLHWVAYALEINRLQGYPVELPLDVLLGGIQGVRAAFYASFHGGRESKPISRETLADLSGASARTQHTYERVASVARRRNMAIGERHTPQNAQERAWRRGRSVFTFVDAHGRQGRKNGQYVAWHLPNSYQTAYARRSRGSRKRLNRKLKDLLTKGITGNVETVVERLFFPNGALAAKRFNRSPEADAYWLQGEARGRRGSLWAVLAGRNR